MKKIVRLVLICATIFVNSCGSRSEKIQTNTAQTKDNDGVLGETLGPAVKNAQGKWMLSYIPQGEVRTDSVETDSLTGEFLTNEEGLIRVKDGKIIAHGSKDWYIK